jgi:outer membrane receptor protein involved in Fe transport
LISFCIENDYLVDYNLKGDFEMKRRLFKQLKLFVFFIVCIFFCNNSLFAQQQQNSAKISGIIIEQSSIEPVEFVNIALFRAKDSSLVMGVSTDKNGLYNLNDVAKGIYYIRISFIGFETIFINSISIVTDGQQMDNGTNAIKASASVLGGVEVTDSKSIYETSIDRKVYNVDKDIMGASGSASDILQNVPSVNVDIDGNVSLRGSANVAIFINGKPSPMMKANSADALQQIPAGNIERIEIITNPSAKYKPDGTTGIINIVMKKGTKTGLNGSLKANIGMNWRYNAGFSLNYKPGKVNMFCGYSFRQDERVRKRTYHRLLYDSTGILYNTYDQSSEAKNRPISHIANLGFEYSINDKNETGISGDLMYRNFKRKENAITTYYDASQVLTNDFNRNNDGSQIAYEADVSAYYEHKFKKEDHSLRFDATYSIQSEVEDNHFTEIYRAPFLPDSYDNTLIDENDKVLECSAEYVYPINEVSEFEAGYAGEFSWLDLNYSAEYFNSSSDAWIKDILKSNEFLLNQYVHALYATYSHEWGSFSLLGGVRAEQVYLTSNLVTLDSLIPNNYFKVYPTLHLAYDLSESSQLQLNYSKRINRPETDELNPFPEYNDPRNLRAGNPYVKPEQIHSVEFGYQLKNKHITFVPTAFYRYKFDAFTEITKFINDTTQLTTIDNLANEQSAGIELVLNSSIKKFMTINFSADGFFDQIDASNLGYSAKKTAFSWNAKLGLNFNITKNTFLQVTGFYRAHELTPQGKELAVYSVNAGIRQDFLKKKLSLLLTVSDIFNTMRMASIIDTPTMYEETTGKRKSQIIYLGLSWRFGNTGKKQPEDIKFDDRMGFLK